MCFAALLAAVAATTQVFWDVEPAAGKLLLPYLAWTAYATVLNAWIWNHNPRVSPSGSTCAVKSSQNTTERIFQTCAFQPACALCADAIVPNIEV